jgi:dephospho-CoA kinase
LRGGVASIGLTGGIGSGKSTVAETLQACGAWLVDTDAIAHELTRPGGAALPALRAEFGTGIVSPDGSLDRARMRAVVFADPASKRRLERLLHPMIAAVADERAAQAGGRTVVFDVPLLTESARWRARVSRVLVVDCPETLQVDRVMRRAGWDAEAAQRVIAQQSSRAARRAIADAVIFNGERTTLDGLARQARLLWRGWVDG